MTQIEENVLLADSLRGALRAGEAIMEVYQTTFSVEYKADHSPLTEADKLAHEAILNELETTGIPILSEEGKSLSYDERQRWRQLWVVDPLDGTKEFVKQNGEFTVNIALVENQVPIMGVIYVPVEKRLYFAAPHMGAVRVEQVEPGTEFESVEELVEMGVPLPEQQERPWRMVGSRSHMNEETSAFLETFREDHPDTEVISKGSSLKICLVAEGSADIYPRFAPTMEWDTAAGHAIARHAGCEILQVKNEGQPLVYNKEDLLNPWFVVQRRG